MRPLELRTYEPIGVTGWYRGDTQAIFPAEKRFTDAELAAEYWAPNWLTMRNADWEGDYEGTSAEMKRRMAALHRFATHPHYSDAD